MSLSADQILHLKSNIAEHLSQSDVFSQVREIVAEQLRSSGAPPADALLDTLQERGVVDQVLRSISTRGITAKPAAAAEPARAIAPGRRYLHLKLLGGKAFLDVLSDEDAQNPPAFTLHILFGNQRYASSPVASAVEPAFQDAFLIDLHPNGAASALGKPLDARTLLALNQPVHLVLTRADPSGATVIGTHALEWRKVLRTGAVAMSVELSGTGAQARVPIGVVDLRLEVLPRLRDPLPEPDILQQLKRDRTAETEADRRFFVYAKNWWREYLQIRPSHNLRAVKIFAQTEAGVNRPVCTFVRPLRAGRLIDSPRAAARFVSLIPYQKDDASAGGAAAETWNSQHAFLCQLCGDAQDHALLLCSLLLGFGLDAYVCVGTDGSGPHLWVMTISSPDRIWFWESLTGKRYLLGQKGRCPYVKLGCAFSHEAFYANVQESDRVESARYDLHNPDHWKPMNQDVLRTVTPQLAAPLSAPDASTVAADEEAVEKGIRAQMVHHRRGKGLATVFDDNLEYLLTPALSSYELERVTGLSVGSEEFQQGIKRAVPEGHTFKGFPIQFAHLNHPSIFVALTKEKIAADILATRGDAVRFAVRCRIFLYPENVKAVWVMVAVRYHQL